ncbi:chemotaxis protein CheB [Xanthomonas campestris pv. campestris]|nr:chemotaxis protein CheB [Xanthomonas campestris pv. campestris]
MVDNDLHPQQHRDVIVIGGSAGASEALRRLLSALPAQTPAAILVVLHMSAHGHGIMRTVSAGANGITVVEAADGMRIEPHTLYVAVADRHLMVADGRIVLGTGPRENMSRPSIDALFRSAAVAFGPRTVGVLLSGMLNDGTAGLDAIHACGGTVLVQDPGEAVASDMPLSALQRVPADAVRSSAELGGLIAELAQTAAGPARVITDALRLEVAIARGALTTTDDTARIATPVAMSCPACGGVLSQISESSVLRFRCQVGHAYTGESLLSATKGRWTRRCALPCASSTSGPPWWRGWPIPTPVRNRIPQRCTAIGRTNTAAMQIPCARRCCANRRSLRRWNPQSEPASAVTLGCRVARHA